MKSEKFLQLLNDNGINYFSGVPDSQLSAFTDALVNKYGFDPRFHTVAVNEGCATAMAAGYHLSTGKTACVYMQNSGLGNAVNPITSLLNTEVYSIGCLFIIGWRGEPNIHDEPQHVFMGKITLPTLDLLGIKYTVIDESTDSSEFESELKKLSDFIKNVGGGAAIIVKKNALSAESKPAYKNDYTLCRESVIEEIAALTGENDVVISTTGKISRELYEARKRLGAGGGKDFLTVGSMGHCSSIALSIAIQRPDKRVIAIDGDGAALMHMGAMATIGRLKPQNFVHILLDNSAHETVGGMPTGSEKADFCAVALNAGYQSAIDITDKDIKSAAKKLSEILSGKKLNAPVFVRVAVALGSRADLGRPKEKAVDNKALFMKNFN